MSSDEKPRTNDAEVEALMASIRDSDEGARARYFATIFEKLTEYENFNQFVHDNFVVIHSIEQESGLLAISVEPIVQGKDEAIADVFKNAQEKDEL